jgi:hypothetical protein
MTRDIDSELQYLNFDSVSEVRTLNIYSAVQCAR